MSLFETNKSTIDDVKTAFSLVCTIEEHLNSLWHTKPHADLQHNRFRLIYEMRLTDDAINALNLYIKQFALASVSVYKSQVEIDVLLSLED